MPAKLITGGAVPLAPWSTALIKDLSSVFLDYQITMERQETLDSAIPQTGWPTSAGERHMNPYQSARNV